MLNIYVNAHPYQIALNSNLDEVIQLAGFADQVVAVAVNGEFIPKSTYSQTSVSDKDNIDVVKPIGGG